MKPRLVRTLHARRPHIRARWQELLHAAPVNTPLTNPDLLVQLLDSTLDEVFGVLRGQPARHDHARTASFDAARADCHCGRNPLLAYFLAGERALLEALVFAQAAPPVLDAAILDHAVAELYLAVRSVAQQEVSAFCSVCRHGPTSTALPPSPSSGIPHLPRHEHRASCP